MEKWVLLSTVLTVCPHVLSCALERMKMHFIRKVGGWLCSGWMVGWRWGKLSKSLSEFSSEIEIVFLLDTHTHTHTHGDTCYYQCYCEEMLLMELLLKNSWALMWRTGQGKALCGWLGVYLCVCVCVYIHRYIYTYTHTHTHTHTHTYIYIYIWSCSCAFCTAICVCIGGCGSRVPPASCYRKVASSFPLVCMSKCPWARCWTP